ncbi:MAG: YqgE/AlgH family protein [Myxococcales bacterium]|nr:YqgE/AlgH family protein [Myxococcales bacterium]
MSSKLAPGFLVAAPSLLDPNFRRSVVLLVDHRPEGSLGFVINRPADSRLRAMLEPLGLELEDSQVVDCPVLVGGPVNPSTGWVVFEHNQMPAQVDAEEVVEVSGKVSVTASRDLLEKLVQRQGEDRMLLVLGYAGWGPGQLDAEIAQGAWIPIDFDPGIVFDTPYEQRWTAALRSLGIDPARLALQAPTEN